MALLGITRFALHERKLSGFATCKTSGLAAATFSKLKFALATSLARAGGLQATTHDVCSTSATSHAKKKEGTKEERRVEAL